MKTISNYQLKGESLNLGGINYQLSTIKRFIQIKKWLINQC